MDEDVEMTSDIEEVEGQARPELDEALPSESLVERKLYVNPRADERPKACATKFDEAVDVKWDEAPLAPVVESGASLRSDALFLSSPALLEASITTAQIMTWVHRTTACKGLEWISDTSLCIVYDSLQSSLAALEALSVSDDVGAELNALAQAYERLSNIYDPPLPADIELIACLRPVKPFKTSAGDQTSAPFARLALTTDVKQRKAGAKSTFYQRNGVRAGKAVSELEERMGGRRERRKEGDDRQSALERLDAELDAIRSQDVDVETESPVRRRGPSPPSSNARTRDRDAARERRKREALDAELDGFARRDDEDVSGTREKTPDAVNDLLLNSIKTRGGMASEGLWGDLTAEEQGDFVAYRQTRPKPQLSYGLKRR